MYSGFVGVGWSEGGAVVAFVPGGVLVEVGELGHPELIECELLYVGADGVMFGVGQESGGEEAG